MIETQEERDKFTQIYEQYYSLLIKIAFDKLRNGQDAEDAVQQAFLKLIPNLGKINIIPSHQTLNYLVTMVERVCFDMYNVKKQIHTIPYDENDLTANDAAEDGFVKQMRFSDLHDAIRALPLLHSEVLYLMYCEDRSVKYIAGTLGISVNAAKKRLERARHYLKTAMLSEDEGVTIS